ncbi:MAG: hypothetical protein A3G24_02640 [Betaproteobacteria bacterium RIFCSPLOWO2_12_FULL_62_13]|nr:MAG: hypothetical protein A3G24_02640 [Betaproteobacteria bacterium RIFCSPLOWO2_12_FULL_62_13]
MGEERQPSHKASPWQVAKAVFWSFLGIRKRAAHERDAVRLTMMQVVIAGIIGAAILVLTLVTLVRFITR